MITGNEIIICKIANGWMVRTPRPQLRLEEEMFAKMPDLIKMATQQKDPLLEQIEEEEKKTITPPAIIEDKSLFMFSTFKEVLSFLEYKFIEA